MSGAARSIVPEVDVLLHEPARLRVLALLAMVESADFMYLLRQTALSRGNLSVQLSRLEEGGIIRSDRQLVDARPRTSYVLTDEGIGRLKGYKHTMLALLASCPG